MKLYEEIRRELVEGFGFTDLEAYRRWVEDDRPKMKLSQELLLRLSPDHVDCRDFWRACDELFVLDPVCNLAVAPGVGRLPYPIETRMDANRMNLRFAKSLGITAFLEENAQQRLRVLEVGPGFGSLMHFIETHTNHEYTGVDVAPRLPGIVQATAQGLIPEALLKRDAGTYSYVVASNVFQHLSSKQRARYYEDARHLLMRGGLFVFNLCVDTGKQATCETPTETPGAITTASLPPSRKQTSTPTSVRCSECCT